MRGIARPIASAGSAIVSVMTLLTVTPRRLPACLLRQAAGRSVTGEGGFQVGDGAVCFLIGEQVSTGDARGVIDAHMQVRPALVRQAHRPLAGSITRDAVSGADQPPALLDVEMNHVARVITDIPLQGGTPTGM